MRRERFGGIYCVRWLVVDYELSSREQAPAFAAFELDL